MSKVRLLPHSQAPPIAPAKENRTGDVATSIDPNPHTNPTAKSVASKRRKGCGNRSIPITTPMTDDTASAGGNARESPMTGASEAAG